MCDGGNAAASKAYSSGATAPCASASSSSPDNASMCRTIVYDVVTRVFSESRVAEALPNIEVLYADKAYLLYSTYTNFAKKGMRIEDLEQCALTAISDKHFFLHMFYFEDSLFLGLVAAYTTIFCDKE